MVAVRKKDSKKGSQYSRDKVCFSGVFPAWRVSSHCQLWRVLGRYGLWGAAAVKRSDHCKHHSIILFYFFIKEKRHKKIHKGRDHKEMIGRLAT